VVAVASGSGLDEVRGGQWLLGPFETTRLWQPWTFRAVTGADWASVIGSWATIVTAVFVAALALLFNVGGTELLLDRDLDTNRELRDAGVLNVVSGALGGIPGYHALSLTALAARMNVDARRAGLIAALVPLAAVVAGASFVQLIPRAIVSGALLGRLGIAEGSRVRVKQDGGQGEAHGRLHRGEHADQALRDSVPYGNLAGQLVLSVHDPVLVHKGSSGLLGERLGVGDHLRAGLLNERPEVPHDVNPETIQEVRHVVREPEPAEMAVNDQPVDRGERAAKLLPMRAFESARHVHLSEEVIMPHVCPEVSPSVLVFGCGRRLRCELLELRCLRDR